MKRFVPSCLLLGILFAAAPLAARDNQPQFKTIVVKHFVNANGMSQSMEFITYFCESMRNTLQKAKIAVNVVEEGVAVPDTFAAESIVLEGKFTDIDRGGMLKPGILNMEILAFRVSDHALVKTIPIKSAFKPSPLNKDKNIAEFTGMQTAYQLRQSLKNVSLSSIPPAPPGTGSTTLASGSASSAATAQGGPEVLASLQFTSNPTGAEITVDGNYAGSTPSLIKVRPGAHSIKVSKSGYAPWVRSITTEPGESRNIAADLDKAGQ